jgi:DNA processing protein
MRLIVPGSSEFPPLPETVDPTVVRLWAIGEDLRALGPMVAIVGTRRPTPYGLDIAARLAADLARAGICVVSGMALGVDAAAHEGALRAGGRTLAVLGSGADVRYPADNAGLYARIVGGGAVVSELPPGSDPRREHFPLRNRIIAALSLGVVFVQGRAGRSGAMGTASRAHELDREVLAVPGDVRAAMSSGPHAVLREGWGSICTDANDVLSVLAPELGWAVEGRHALVIPPGLSPERRSALAALGDGPATASVLAARAGLDLAIMRSALSGLELAGLVTRDIAGVFTATASKDRARDDRRP